MQAVMHRRWPGLALLGLLTLAGLAYGPGLHGGFLFDDFVNLNAIGATGPVDNWPAFWRYITSGTADPIGRPLALLSFLVDARDWPADPAPFLRDNLILHLINGALLFALLRALGQWLDADGRRRDAAALLGAGLWLLHPLLVSTTLYIVQREAMLPTTFTLLGLLAYVHGRARYQRQGWPSGAAWMIAGIVLGSGLATLCKGNGLLLPLLAWALEATVLSSATATSNTKPSPALHPGESGSTSPDKVPDRALRRLRFLLLVIPSVAISLYLASFLRLLNTPLGSRPWTIAQRLLTEPRVLLDYLQLLLVPRSVSSGLYNDGYAVSTGMLQPWNTLPAALIVLSLPLLAFRYRLRFPSLSAAVLFFFAGHLLESTIVPIELYFEHRNYLPALLLFWPLARSICAWQVAPRVRIAVAGALLGLFAVTTYQRVEMWGRPEQLATLWARQNPESSRAQVTIAMLETKAGNPEAATRRLAPLWRNRPDDLQIAFNYIDAACAWRGLSADDSLKLADSLRTTTTSLELIHTWIGNAIDVAGTGQCRGLGLADTEGWLAAALQNPSVNNPQIRDQDIEPLLAQLAMQKRQPDIALQHFDRALAAFTTPDVAARQASALASRGYYRQALAHLDSYERLKGRSHPPSRGMPQLHAMVLQWQGYWPREMTALRAKLKAQIAASSEGAGKISPKGSELEHSDLKQSQSLQPTPDRSIDGQPHE